MLAAGVAVAGGAAEGTASCNGTLPRSAERVASLGALAFGEPAQTEGDTTEAQEASRLDALVVAEAQEDALVVAADSWLLTSDASEATSKSEAMSKSSCLP